MPDEGFGAGLWKNVQSVRFGEDGGLEVPVRANARDGIVFGVDAIAESEARPPAEEPREPAAGRPRGRWRRLLRRRS